MILLCFVRDVVRALVHSLASRADIAATCEDILDKRVRDFDSPDIARIPVLFLELAKTAEDLIRVAVDRVAPFG